MIDPKDPDHINDRDTREDIIAKWLWQKHQVEDLTLVQQMHREQSAAAHDEILASRYELLLWRLATIGAIGLAVAAAIVG